MVKADTPGQVAHEAAYAQAHVGGIAKLLHYYGGRADYEARKDSA
jgi:hypothetical protein